MQVKFTHHAVQQMESREFTRDMVENLVQFPDTTYPQLWYHGRYNPHRYVCQRGEHAAVVQYFEQFDGEKIALVITVLFKDQGQWRAYLKKKEQRP